ncbi:MAG: hypothetical protein DCC55_40320 [Chloroflexi bacterium]|nr:MAG: hypothetical protein DCC55_40320 [Chloroflexota bacterium]
MSSGHWRTICQRAAAEQAIQEARTGWRLADNQPVPFDHRWEHVQEVVRLALWLAHETNADLETVEAAAWLHDVCKGQRSHAALGATAATRILAKTDFPAGKIPAVADTIRQHEKLYRPADAAPLQPIEAAVLWDADKLTKLGAQALAFMLSAHYLAGQPLDERLRNCEEFTQETLSRTVRSMNTAPARQLAVERYQHMVQVLDLWRQENEF